MGIIGGRPKHSLYFVGFQGKILENKNGENNNLERLYEVQVFTQLFHSVKKINNEAKKKLRNVMRVYSSTVFKAFRIFILSKILKY